MAHLTIQLSDDVARDLEAQARAAGKSSEEYAAKLLAEQRDQEQVEQFHELIREGDESGDPIPVDDHFFDRMKEELRQA